uniref:Rho GTPase-activating protein 29 n=1 Tax=Esox lucius TaxID=8010 RepID=A0A3P8XLR2_ESOLU
MFQQKNNTKQNKPCSTCSSRLCNPNTGSLSAGSTKAWDIGQSSRPANPLGCMGLGYNSLGSGSGLAGGPGVDPDYVMQLVNDVRRFADVLLSLKEAFHSKESHDDLPQRVQERLAELLRVLKSVIGKHQTLNSADILGSAGTVIAKVKGINFKDVNQENKNTVFGEIYASIDTLAFTFGNVVSDFLMGDVDSQSGLGIPQTRRSRVSQSNAQISPGGALSKEEEVDLVLQKNDNGVESALLYAKAWSKYTKDLLAWVDKRLGVDIECAKSYAKLAESAKTLFSQQDYMPFRDMYMSTFRCDMEYSQLLIQTANALQTNRFIQPLQARKNELDRLRKDIKEQWQRQQRKMQESEMAVRKAGLTQAQRREEYQKAHSSANRSQEEPNKQLDRKRRQEEEALQKVEEAREQYRACAAEAGVRRAELAETKTAILTQIRELLAQCDLTLKAVTVNWCQLQRGQTASLPLHYQAQCDGAKLYEPGQRYAEFLFVNPPPPLSVSLSVLHVFCPDLKGGQGPVKGWPSGVQDRGMCSDSESAGGSSESRSIDSPTASPGDFKRRLPRTPSTGTMSSADDLDERELPSPSDNGLGEMVTETASSPGPFRNAQMSKASQTHKLRKLRAPSKCRECDSLVVFHGAECEECSLACHKKCLETLAIQCGHKKLQGRLHLFGIDFTQAAKNSPDGIPFIIKKCTSEIESRALNLKGIYRVNGAKSRVEKLCQAFENGKDLVELSDLSPHDIGNVLKLYLRQLPEPLILYRFYNEFIGLAKECQRVIIEEKAAGEQPPLRTSHIKLNRVVFKIRDLLRQLPSAHYRTLRFLTAHLHRVTEQSEENKMTASNLGIIFGPTLVKPRQTDAEVSLSSLVDYPYQALMVELMVRHFEMIFDVASPSSPSSPLPSPLPNTTTSTLGHASPRLLPQEQRLNRHSTSLLDIKEVRMFVLTFLLWRGAWNEAFQCPISACCILCMGEMKGEVDPTYSTLMTQSTLVFASIPNAAPQVQLRPQRSRMTSRPISMPLERLPHPRNGRSTTTTDTITESPEPDKEPEKERFRSGVGSRVSTHYITPFIESQVMQRKTWDKKYKHYDVTPRTAMIMANIPAAGPVPQLTTPPQPSTLGPASSAPPTGSSVMPVSPLTFRQPRTMQPPPGTFYKPPGSSGTRGWPSFTGSTGHTNTSPTSPNVKTSSSPTDKTFSSSPTIKTSSSSPMVKSSSSPSVLNSLFLAVPSSSSPTVPPSSSPSVQTSSSPPVTAPLLSSFHSSTITSSSSPVVSTTSPTSPNASPTSGTTNLSIHSPQDSVDSSVSGEFMTSADLSPPQSPPPSSPEDHSPTEVKPLHPRLRQRPRPHLQDLEHREAHFV